MVAFQGVIRLLLVLGLLQTSSNAQVASRINPSVPPYVNNVLAQQGVAQLPHIDALSVISAYVGMKVTISGTGFGPKHRAGAVFFNGVGAVIVDWDPRSIAAMVPINATTGRVVVTVNGQSSNGVNLTVVPNIAAIVPTSGPAGTAITVSGTGFGSAQGDNTLRIGSVPATVVNWTATTINAFVPRAAATAPLSISVNGVLSSGPSFSVAGPSINSLSSSAARVGVIISVYGSNFGDVPDTVTFNGVAAIWILSWNDTQIDVFVPQGATSGNVVVTAAGLFSNGLPFTVTGFNPVSNLNVGRNGHRAVLLNDGTVLVAGGSSLGGSSLGVEGTAELYDPRTSKFNVTGSLNVPRANDTITLLDDGTVLVTGGVDSSGDALASAEIYDPATKAFTLTGSLTTRRSDHTATRLPDGTVLVAGGDDGAVGNCLSSAELYIPSTRTFVPGGSMNDPRSWSTATALNDGTVLFVGGWSGSNALADAEIYNPATKSFTLVSGLNTARVRHTATLLNTGQVLIVGGAQFPFTALASAELYDPVSGTFATTGGLFVAQANHTATLLTNGEVLVTGGYVCDPRNCTVVTPASNWADLYDPSAGTFTVAITSLNISRQAHTSTLLPDGTVLVAGGWGYNADLTLNRALSNVEVYQPDPANLTPPHLMSLAVSPVNPSIVTGNSQALLAIGTFSDGRTQTLVSATWNSTDTSIASVTNDSGSNSGVGNDSTNAGVVYGWSLGTVTITACAGSLCGSSSVTVQ